MGDFCCGFRGRLAQLTLDPEKCCFDVVQQPINKVSVSRLSLNWQMQKWFMSCG